MSLESLKEEFPLGSSVVINEHYGESDNETDGSPDQTLIGQHGVVADHEFDVMGNLVIIALENDPERTVACYREECTLEV